MNEHTEVAMSEGDCGNIIRDGENNANESEASIQPKRHRFLLSVCVAIQCNPFLTNST